MSTPKVVAVLGAGTAGMSAAIHAARRGVQVKLVDPLGPGGQLQNAGLIETVPGIVGVTGPDLVASMVKQLDGLSVDLELGTAVRLHRRNGRFVVRLDDDRTVEADAVIVATGSSHRHIGVTGELELEFRGVSHCAVCDGPLFSGRPVVVVGGGDAAADSALALAGVTTSVTLVHRGHELRAVETLARRVAANPAITCLLDTEIVSIDGDERVEGVTLRALAGGETRRIDASGVFVAVGMEVDTSLIGDLVDRDEAGRVIVDVQLMSRTPGLFAAGAARSGTSDQLATAIGDGVAAATGADRWLRGELDASPIATTGQASSFADYEAFLDDAMHTGLSDGLPVVPPTAARLERFVAASALAADEPLGTLPDGSTVRCADAVACAVVAGCSPEHVPIVIAAVRALLSSPVPVPSQVLADAVQAIIVNGPERLRVDLNCSDGLLGPGWRANATIGRALRLFTTSRFDLPPASSFGDPGQYTMCFGEDEEKSPWTPLHVSRGLTADASAVTVFTAPVYRMVMDRRHNDSAGIVEYITLFIRGKASGTTLFGDAGLSLMLVIGQELRRLLTPDYSKEQLRDELFARITADDSTPLHPVRLASPDDLSIVSAGGVAFPTAWLFTSPVAPSPTTPLP